MGLILLVNSHKLLETTHKLDYGLCSKFGFQPALFALTQVFFFLLYRLQVISSHVIQVRLIYPNLTELDLSNLGQQACCSASSFLSGCDLHLPTWASRRVAVLFPSYVLKRIDKRIDPMRIVVRTENGNPPRRPRNIMVHNTNTTCLVYHHIHTVRHCNAIYLSIPRKYSKYPTFTCGVTFTLRC